jgi:hypothetical protein
MLQISQPFSYPGPTRMSHKKCNLSGLSVLARKAGAKRLARFFRPAVGIAGSPCLPSRLQVLPANVSYIHSVFLT